MRYARQLRDIAPAGFRGEFNQLHKQSAGFFNDFLILEIRVVAALPKIRAVSVWGGREFQAVDDGWESEPFRSYQRES